jgi:putative transposase
MPKTEHYYVQFEKDKTYHVYNISVDRKPMFASDRNYDYFLTQSSKYLSNFVDILAYSLLNNHFHFLIKIKDLDLATFQKLSNLKDDKKTIHDIISHQFKKFFQSYAMAFNKQQNRIGTLFQTPFKRVCVDNERNLRELICYINTDAQRHYLVDDFKKWKWSSYQQMVTKNNQEILKDEVLSCFDDLYNFVFDHHEFSIKKNLSVKDYFIED